MRSGARGMVDTQHAGQIRQRQWTAAEKLEIVQQSFAGSITVTAVARRYQVSKGSIYSWRKQASAGKLSAEPDGQSRFALVAIAGASTVTRPAESNDAGSMVEVVLRNGRILRLPETTGPSRAASLADALEGTRP